MLLIQYASDLKVMQPRTSHPATTLRLNIVGIQSHSATVLRNVHRQVNDPNPVQSWITLIAFADDPSIPLRNAGSGFQLASYGVEPTCALLRRAQSDGLWTGWICLVGAHVDIEGHVSDAERDTVRFDNSSVGVGLLGLVYKSDVILAGNICFRVTHYVLSQQSSVQLLVALLTKDVFELRRLAFPLLEIAAKDNLLSVLSFVIERSRVDSCSKHTSERKWKDVYHIDYYMRCLEVDKIERNPLQVHDLFGKNERR